MSVTGDAGGDAEISVKVRQGLNSYATASFIIIVINVYCTARRAPVMDAGFSVCLRGDKEGSAPRYMLQPPPPPPPVGRSDQRLLSIALVPSFSRVFSSPSRYKASVSSSYPHHGSAPDHTGTRERPPSK
ncbi:unnamed protein product [Pleuronectes platessa]|uniref:Uncharacterized protein n=1 Tax=Pleuronectes platessa TaxID=8262 RepID=A0A9N7VTP1_PLEPL|nr:unnamed protein product [Pleuronectes platessa]